MTTTPTELKKLSKEIAQHTEEFLAKGNTITELGITKTVCEWENHAEERKAIAAKAGKIANTNRRK